MLMAGVFLAAVQQSFAVPSSVNMQDNPVNIPLDVQQWR
jgi:hypothetical protein